MNDIEFSALLCSRLCHDLISPVGAIANGLEILGDEEDEMMRAEVMTLLGQSAEVTSSRLKFYRLSFGAAGGFGEKVPIREAESAVNGLYNSGKINLTWHSDVGLVNKDALKVMLNLILLAGESLIRGGDLLVEIRENNPGIEMTVTVRGDKIILQDSTRQALLGELGDEQIEAKSAPAFLAASVAARLGTKIGFTQHNEQSFSFQTSYQDKE
ncbi:histidine phosphotransferase family protein [Paremcibacter congregatus]|uniref:histidine phosphotransferase family protein n=1 Tax=Paremcibacter congregatus TaxID=2043170 RepID=UPI0030ED3DFB|tara:strand:- start:470 stop:1108 length:639 start_codon:yes stop_codon:yes gene_type:complete